MPNDDSFLELWNSAIAIVPDEENRRAKRQKLANSKCAYSVMYDTMDQREEDTISILKRLFFATLDVLLAELNKRFGDENNEYFVALGATDPANDDFLSFEQLQPLGRLPTHST